MKIKKTKDWYSQFDNKYSANQSLAFLSNGKLNSSWVSSSPLSNNKTWFYQLGEILEKLTDTPVVYIDPPQYTKQVDVGNFLVDNSKLCSLGWKPSIPLQNGIKKTLDYFQSLK